jgi:general secretion pathway protein D
MRSCNKLAIFLVFLMAIPPLPARTKKGEKFLAQGKKAELSKQWDQALEQYEQALSEDPTDPAYQMAAQRIRFQAGAFHIDLGQKLRAGGKLDEALTEFERAYRIDPSSSMAETEIRRTRGMIEREKKKGAAANPEERGMTPSELARKQTQERVDRIQALPELKPLSPNPINLKMNNQPPRVLFETVGKLAGVNVLFDPDFTSAGSRAMSVEFANSTLEEALDHLAVMTKSFWKPLSSSTIFVTQDNTTKRRDYEEQVMKVFYLQNVNTPQELQEVATTVRGICDIRRLFTYNAQMAIIVRAEADRVALAEKVISDMDKPRSEVVIDILVMEAARSRSRDLAFTAARGGINTPISYNGTDATKPTTSSTGTGSGTGSSTTTTTTTPGGQRILNIGQYSITLPLGALQAVMKDSGARILQSPQLRAADSAKASVKIGDKIPIASGSFQPGIGGVGINPLVNTQFQFIDVGVNVDITPKIHSSEEVSLKVDVDISNRRETVNLGGIEQPIIGQRKVSFEVRMKEGEMNVLGGLINVQETKSVSGIPFLGSIPILKRFFTEESIERSENELLFILIPHIVRSPEITEQNMKGIAVGNDQVVKLSFASRRPAGAPVAPAAGKGAPPPALPVTAPPETAPPATAPPPPPPKPTGPKLTFAPARAEGNLGGAISVTLVAEGVTDLFAAPMRIKYDPKVVQLTDVTPGNLLSLDGLKPGPAIKNILNDIGEAHVTVSRLPGAGGVTGSGNLATFVFQAVGKGTADIAFQELLLRNARLQEQGVTAPQVQITVK